MLLDNANMRQGNNARAIAFASARSEYCLPPFRSPEARQSLYSKQKPFHRSDISLKSPTFNPRSLLELSVMPTAITAIILLTISNAFMTVAWYGHLKFENVPLWKVVLISWGIAFFEYCFQVPANRIGNMGGLSATQLKIMQEVITLVVFCVFANTYLGEKIAWNHYLGFACVLLAVFFVYYPW
jgi:uncharacterized protein